VSELIESGRIADFILIVIAIEAAVVCTLAVASKSHLPAAGLLLNLGAGAGLLLALRAVANDAGWMAVGLWLIVALLAHLADLFWRLRR
jgi:hypothetical protein